MSRIFFWLSVFGIVISLTPAMTQVFLISAILLTAWHREQLTIEFNKNPVVIVLTSYLLSMIAFTAVSIESESFHVFTFKLYMLSLYLFHVSEFLCQSYYNPKSATFATYLLNHSFHYNLAIAISICEDLFWMLFSVSVLHYLAFMIGVCLVIIGHVFRIGSEINAGSCFNHKIQYDKTKDPLVTSGFYRICRHPSYLGWFIWSVGTQIMLGNPISAVGFFVASLRFFKERIEFEEYLLLRQYGYEYIKFMESTPQFLPFCDILKIEKPYE